MKINSLSTVAAGLLLATIALQAAQAQTRPTRMVNRDELRTCMNSESDLVARRQLIDGRNQQQREEAAAIRAESEELKAEQQRLEQDQKPMERFQRKVKVHNTRVQAAQAAAETFRVDLASLSTALDAHNQSCGAISFNVEDKDAILKERSAPKN